MTHDEVPGLLEALPEVSEGLSTLQDIVEQEPEQEIPQQTIAQQQRDVETVQMRNFRQMRERQEQTDRELERLRRELEKKNQEPVEDLEFSVAPDDLLQGSHAYKLQKKLKRQEEMLAKQQQQMEQLLIESRLRAQYPDFDQIVTKDNLEALSSQHPEITQTLRSSTDLYSSAATAYTVIKNLGLSYHPAAPAISKEKETIQKNAAKPKPIGAVGSQQGSSPLTRVNDYGQLTQEMKDKIYEEMQSLAKMPR